MAGPQADCPITLQGEQLVLLPERAIFWPDRATLVISDLHIGKAAAFAPRAYRCRNRRLPPRWRG